MEKRMRHFLLTWGILMTGLLGMQVSAQFVPQHITYYRVYELLDELANEGLIELNSAVKPYSRQLIATHLETIARKIASENENINLPRRIVDEIHFYLDEFALENKRLPRSDLRILNTPNAIAGFWPTSYNFVNEHFRARITPILGMHLVQNSHGTLDRRWYGAEFQGMIGNNLSVFGSIRDISHTGMPPLSMPHYLNDQPGYEYTLGTDFSDSRGGIAWANDFVRFGIKKDNVVWGDHNHASNILSGRVPSFPMVFLHLKPSRWFELNYFHGWLVSNVIDSTEHYIDNLGRIHYRPTNKFMAANFFTFTPWRNFKFSIGNSIIYAEQNVHLSYFIPIAFYKSMDHVQTKGIKVENQNSQLFLNVSSRNLKHLHLYGSLFIDEMRLRRFLPYSSDRNPISYQLGAQLTNFPVNNISVTAEYTRTNIITYKHSIPALSYTSNSYFLGHYLGDNAQSLFLGMKYKPLRGLDLEVSWLNDLKGNDYEYVRQGVFNNIRGNIIQIISNPSLGDIIWRNSTLRFRAVYEVFQNAYAVVHVEQSNIQSFDAQRPIAFGENRMTATEVLNRFTPTMLQGKNTTYTIGFSFGF